MRFSRWLSTFVMFFGLAIMILGSNARAQSAASPAPARKPFTMTVTGFADGADIPAKYTQAGNQTSPAIEWADPPAGTVSFVLHVHDVDVTRNHTTDDQLHWLVWNIPPTATGLAEGIPAGTQLSNGAYQISANGQVYRGPGAPATGPKHHYVFELYALDAKVDVPSGSDVFATRTELMKAIEGHILGKVAYVGLFHRPQ